MSLQDAHTAAVGAWLELLLTSGHVSQGVIIPALKVAGFVFALKTQLLEVPLGVSMHRVDLDLARAALLGALASSFLPGHEAVVAVDTLAVGTFDGLLDYHGADAAAEVLRLFLGLLVGSELVNRQVSLKVHS